MSAIVWLSIDGELKKCVVSDSVVIELQYIAGCISMAREHDDHDSVTYWTNERTRAANDIVKSGQYEVVGS